MELADTLTSGFSSTGTIGGLSFAQGVAKTAGTRINQGAKVIISPVTNGFSRSKRAGQVAAKATRDAGGGKIEQYAAYAGGAAQQTLTPPEFVQKAHKAGVKEASIRDGFGGSAIDKAKGYMGAAAKETGETAGKTAGKIASAGVSGAKRVGGAVLEGAKTTGTVVGAPVILPIKGAIAILGGVKNILTSKPQGRANSSEPQGGENSPNDTPVARNEGVIARAGAAIKEVGTTSKKGYQAFKDGWNGTGQKPTGDGGGTGEGGDGDGKGDGDKWTDRDK